jgi:hypothetical protein
MAASSQVGDAAKANQLGESFTQPEPCARLLRDYFFSSAFTGATGLAVGAAGFTSSPAGFAGLLAAGGAVAGFSVAASSVQPATNAVASTMPESIAESRVPIAIFTFALLER